MPPWVAASGWLPHGRGQHTALRALIGALHRRHYQRGRPGGPPPLWVEARTWIAAMDYDTGQQVLFGADGAPRASLPDAVVASCSIPGWYEPAIIGGRRYVDGGVRSTTSLKALSGTDVEEIYVLAPMASTDPDHPLQPHLRMERRFRQVNTSILLRQARALGAQGKRVTVLTPGRARPGRDGRQPDGPPAPGGRARRLLPHLGRIARRAQRRPSVRSVTGQESAYAGARLRSGSLPLARKPDESGRQMVS